MGLRLNIKPKFKNVKEVIDGRIVHTNENTEIAPSKIKNCLMK